jgi:uncharacterized membrane protein
VLLLSVLDINVVIALACWSVWGILDKKALENSTDVGVAFRLYSMTLIQLPVILVALKIVQPHFVITPEVWLWTGLAAVFQAASLFAYLTAMSVTEASLVLGVTASYPVITQFLAVLFLGEKLLPLRTLGSAAIAAGVIGIGLSLERTEETKLSRKDFWKLVGNVTLATFGWGIWGIFDKKAIQHGTPLEVWLAEGIWELSLIVLAFIVIKATKYQVEVRNKKAWFFATLSAISLSLGRLAFLWALSLAAASYVIAITGCYPLFMYFLALLFLKEKMNKARLAGISLVVAGGIAVQWSLS